MVSIFTDGGNDRRRLESALSGHSFMGILIMIWSDVLPLILFIKAGKTTGLYFFNGILRSTTR